jgi:tRNA (guanine37-N1)-methyltransferase
MPTFHLITIFPNIFDSYIKEGILRKAQKAKKIKIKVHNLRDFSVDKRGTVDDSPFGGGPGMVFKVEPIQKAIKKIKAGKNKRIILFSAKGKKFDQKTARRLSKYKDIIFICGRYEGVDERVAKNIADEEISIGDYILSGGELPAIVVTEAVTRLLPGVLGNEESIEETRVVRGETSSYPVYTRPEIVEIDGKKRKVPKVLLSGDHKKVEEWRKDNIK